MRVFGLWEAERRTRTNPTQTRESEHRLQTQTEVTVRHRASQRLINKDMILLLHTNPLAEYDEMF